MALIADSNVEGPVSANPVFNNNQVTLIVAGVTVIADSNTLIRTPTKVLNLTEVVDTTPFPGRSDPGFVNGSAQADGEYDTTVGVLRASRLFLEPAEHVLVGPIANPTDSGAVVNGVNAELTNDARIPKKPIQNEFGFPIKADTIPNDSLAAAEGYYAGGSLRAFLISVDAPDALLKSDGPQVSLMRARVQEKPAAPEEGRNASYRLSVRGAVYPGFTPQRIDVYALQNGIPVYLGSTESRPVRNTPYGKYDDDFKNIPGSAPVSVRVVNVTAPGSPFAEEYVDF